MCARLWVCSWYVPARAVARAVHHYYPYNYYDDHYCHYCCCCWRQWTVDVDRWTESELVEVNTLTCRGSQTLCNSSAKPSLPQLKHEGIYRPLLRLIPTWGHLGAILGPFGDSEQPHIRSHLAILATSTLVKFALPLSPTLPNGSAFHTLGMNHRCDALNCKLHIS